MDLNFKAIAAAAIANIIIGFVWYNPKVMGNTWMRVAKLNQNEMKTMNMPILFGSSFLFAFMLAFAMSPLVIHQFHLPSILMNELNGADAAIKTAAESDMAAFFTKYGNNFRTFKHGAFHGLIYSLFLVLPIVGMNALYENRGWKYIGIHVTYWAISFMVMGGIVCGWQ